MQGKSDEELVREIQGGDILAYEDLVKRYQNKLFWVAAGIVHDEHVAAEVVQDALFTIYQKIDRVDTSRKFGSWAVTITRNLAVSAWRRNKQKTGKLTGEETGDQVEPEKKITDEETRNRVNEAVDRLDSLKKRAIKLYYFEGMSYEEVSRVMAVPLNTVKTYLRRAKSWLKKELK